MLYKLHDQWADLYTRLKGPDWPECPPEVDFYQLPDWVRDELQSFGYRPNKHLPERFVAGEEQKINVFYLPDHEGGGSGHGQEYISIIKNRYPDRVFDRCYEWCAGPGFIGYSILAHGLCRTLCLTDISDSALTCAEETRHYAKNNCRDLVDIYLLKDLALLPEREKFDLIVSNPPHANSFHDFDRWDANINRIVSDINWESHKNFYANIKKHLDPNGIILMQENHCGSTLETFEEMINQAGLRITDSFISDKWYEDRDHTDPTNWPVSKIYYIEIQHKIE